MSENLTRFDRQNRSEIAIHSSYAKTLVGAGYRFEAFA